MSTSARVIVVDDDASIRAIADCLLLRLPGARGGGRHCAGRAAAVERPDVIILDWMMPGEDGLSVCRRLQARAIPILMLSAMGSAPDRVIGLEMGADDYLAKPFDPRELLARVRALLRRQHKLRAQVPSELRFAGWRLLRTTAPAGAGWKRWCSAAVNSPAAGAGRAAGGCSAASSCCSSAAANPHGRSRSRPGGQPAAPQARAGRAGCRSPGADLAR